MRILAVQLALNGAERVHAIDIDRNAVANTLANAFRNGVVDRITGEAVNFYHWEPNEQFDLVVASLYQMPVDPSWSRPVTGRPTSGAATSSTTSFGSSRARSPPGHGVPDAVVDHLPGSDRGTSRGAGFTARVVDYSFFPFGPLFDENREQIERVEQLSDAYHIRMADDDVMVAYLLEIRRAEP